MRIFWLIVILIDVSFPVLGQLGPWGHERIAGTIDIDIDGFSVRSEGWIEYECVYCIDIGALQSGAHTIYDGAVGVVANATFGGPGTFDHTGTLTAGTVYQHCYQAQINGTGKYGFSNGFGSATKCAPPQPSGGPHQPIDICDDPTRTDGTCSPVLINLDAGSYRLSGPDDPVDFDMDGDGSPNHITWTARHSAVAFLAMDRNENRTIDDGTELFGNWTRLRSGLRAENGFEAVEEMDSNGDGLVSDLDEQWPALLLWKDTNHDGLSQPEELQDIAMSVVRAIETLYHWTGRRDSYGNFFRYKGAAHLDRGTRSIYDVYFRRVP